MEDESSQIKGVCHVCYVPSNLLRATPSALLYKYAEEGGDFLASMPYRITSFHFCYNDPTVRFLFSTVRMAFDKDVRLRMRTHFGKYHIATCTRESACGRFLAGGGDRLL
jgi:hypothetical protein